MVLLRRALILTHRWLGIAGSILFVAWFVSGIAMMYARMPRLSAEERLMRIAPLDVAQVRVGAADAARGLDDGPQRVRIGMAEGRPVYRFLVGARWVMVFADTGERVPPLTPPRALAVARDFLERVLYGAEGVDSNALEVHVHSLRRKTAPDLIRTARGLGYVLTEGAEP